MMATNANQAVEINPKDYTTVLQLLKQIDFLNGVPEDILKSMLFALQKQSFKPMKKILFQGEIANQLFIVQKGSVSITTKNKGQKIDLAELAPPKYFGEISLLTPSSATATVTAGDQGADLLILNHDGLAHLSKKLPDITQRIQQVINQRNDSRKKAKEADDKANE